MKTLNRAFLSLCLHFARVDHYLAQQRGDYKASYAARMDMDRIEMALWRLSYE